VVVGVKVEVKRGDRVVATAAVANSGYEAEEPELHLPLALARSLGIHSTRCLGARFWVE
jgi:hypothetical protein